MSDVPPGYIRIFGKDEPFGNIASFVVAISFLLVWCYCCCWKRSCCQRRGRVSTEGSMEMGTVSTAALLDEARRSDEPIAKWFCCFGLARYVHFLMFYQVWVPCIPPYIKSFAPQVIPRVGYFLCVLGLAMLLADFCGLFAIISVLSPGGVSSLKVAVGVIACECLGCYFLMAHFWKDFAVESLCKTFAQLSANQSKTLLSQYRSIYRENLAKSLKRWDRRVGPLLGLLLDSRLDVQAKALRSAMKGFSVKHGGTNEALIAVVALTLGENRKRIDEAYARVTALEGQSDDPRTARSRRLATESDEYKRDLQDDLHDELQLGTFSWNYVSMGILCLFRPVSEARAWLIWCCTKGQWDTDERNVTRLLALQHDERKKVADAFEIMYNVPLVDHLKRYLGRDHAAVFDQIINNYHVVRRAFDEDDTDPQGGAPSKTDQVSASSKKLLARSAARLYSNEEARALSQQGTKKQRQEDAFQRSIFDAKEIAERLKASMQGLGTDEAKLLKTIARGYSGSQLHRIKDEYCKLTKRVLVEDIKKETSGIFEDDDFCRSLLVLLRDPAPYGDRFLTSLQEAMEGHGTDEMGLLILLIDMVEKSRDRAKLLSNYQRKYHRSLADDIEKELSGEMELLILGLVESPSKLWARAFHLALHPQWTSILGNDDLALTYYMALNCGNMREIRSAYRDLYGVELADDVADECDDMFFQKVLDSMIRDRWYTGDALS